MLFASISLNYFVGFSPRYFDAPQWFSDVGISQLKKT